jgi:hypothetical protein
MASLGGPLRIWTAYPNFERTMQRATRTIVRHSVCRARLLEGNPFHYMHTNSLLTCICFSHHDVAPEGIEPSQPFSSQILNLLRLPFRQEAHYRHTTCKGSNPILRERMYDRSHESPQ